MYCSVKVYHVNSWDIIAIKSSCNLESTQFIFISLIITISSCWLDVCSIFPWGLQSYKLNNPMGEREFQNHPGSFILKQEIFERKESSSIFKRRHLLFVGTNIRSWSIFSLYFFLAFINLWMINHSIESHTPGMC